MYQGIAFYHKSQDAFAQDHYGEQVGWLSAAMSCISNPELMKKLKSQPVALQQQFTEIQSTINTSYQSAHYDNSKIYHEPVPRELPPLEKTPMVKAMSMPLKPSTPQDDPFRGLVSKVVSQFSDNYKVC